MRPQKPEITLDLLCNELLMNIRGYIDDDDLLALVCWHNVSTRFQDFLEDYDSIDCTYWQRLCHLNGLGCWEGDDGDEEEDGATWSLFALDCACHAWRCKHPNCGRALLRDNVQAMRDVMVAYPEWDPLDVLEHEDRYSDSDGPDNMTIELTTSFEDIGFALNRDESIRWPWDRSIAYLRSPDEDVCQIPSEDKVEFHEIMMRTFATFPPCKRICYLNLDVMSETENSLGVTVSNVLETVKDCLAKPLSTEDIEYLLCTVRRRSWPPLFPAGWSPEELQSSLTTVNGLFRAIRWVGIDFKSVDMCGWNFNLAFEWRALPERKSELHDGLVDVEPEEEYDPEMTMKCGDEPIDWDWVSYGRMAV